MNYPATADNASCPRSELLAAFSLGNLPLVTMQTVALHIDGCGDCAARVKAFTPDDAPASASAIGRSLRGPSPTEAGQQGGGELPNSLPEPAQAAGDADRQLLFAVLAIQLQLISRTQFAQACAHWAARKDRPLRDALVEATSLSTEDCAEVERLMERVLRKHRGDVRGALGHAADSEMRDAIRDVDDATTRQTLDWLPPAPHFVQVSELEEKTQQTSEQRSRYSFMRIQGQGGLGRVWLARDLVLQRSVALKEPRSPGELSPAAWRQFVVEAQITGQLKHPNIVPVYELAGDRESGDVFYTMRYVRGQTLSGALAAYHERQAAGREDPLELRGLLSAFVAVCQAIAYAHSRGVVHCDLKPGNVMLGAFGEVIVLDWGLAKVTATTSAEEDSAPRIAEELRQPAPTDGHIRGSIPYMSPEQAEGRMNLIDSRTDIYGLGAMLYTILTNEAPHRSKKMQTTRELLRMIQEQPTPRARNVRHSVPPALDAICAKAMAQKRLARYRSAQDLAKDVERWLADQEVSVYRDPPSTRVLRWMRRHRSTTISLATCLLVVTVVAVVSAVFVEGARRRETAALAQATQALAAEQRAKLQEEAAKQEATQWFHQTQQTVDTMLTGVGDVLQFFPGAKVVRSRLLDEAARMYENLVARDADDPSLRLEAARVYVRLGEVRAVLGENAAARAAFQSALDRFDLIAGTADAPDTALDRAACLTKLAGVKIESGVMEAAAAALDDASATLDPLPDGPAVQLARSAVLLQRGQMLSRQQPQLAREHFTAAETILSELAKRPGSAATERSRLVSRLSLARSLLGQALASAGETAAAVAVLKQTRESFRELTRLEPDYPPYLDALAFTEINLANALRTLARDAEQARALDLAIADFTLLVESMPGAPRFRENRAVARTNRAWLLNQRGNNAAARDMLDEAIGELNELYQSSARIPRQLEEIAAAAVVLGQTLSDLDENDAAESNLSNAVAAYERVLLAQDPNSARYARGLGAARRHLACLWHKLDRFEESEREFALAIELLAESLSHVENPFARDELALAHEQLGDLLRQQDREDGARRNYDAARQGRSALPADPEYRFKLARLLSKFADEDLREEAAAVARKLSEEFPRVDRYQSLLGALQLEAGDFAAAIETLSRIETSTAAFNSPHHFLLALAYASRNEPGDQERSQAAQERAAKWMQDHAPGRRELIELHLRTVDSQ